MLIKYTKNTINLYQIFPNYKLFYNYINMLELYKIKGSSGNDQGHWINFKKIISQLSVHFLYLYFQIPSDRALKSRVEMSLRFERQALPPRSGQSISPSARPSLSASVLLISSKMIFKLIWLLRRNPTNLKFLSPN